MNNACTECGAVYAVAEKDIGRRIACKKCSAALIVAEDGLRLDDSDAAAPRKEDAPERERGRDRDEDRGRDDEDRGSRRKRDRDRDRDRDPEDEGRRARPSVNTAEIMNKLKGMGDVATWLYSIGLVLTIYAKYASDLDEGKYQGRMGVQTEEEYDVSVAKREINAKINEDKRTEPNSDEKKKLEDIDKEWTKRKSVLADSVKYAEVGKQRAIWWNQLFKLLGFTILAFGAIGYLKAEQTQLKRILGGVTIALILAQVVGGFPLFR